MSALNWQAMTARERDCLIAEKVMGWEKSLKLATVLDAFRSSGVFYISPVGVLIAGGEEWSPTTCPKAAMEVIEAMLAKGLGVTTAGSVSGRWVCEFWKEGESVHGGVANTQAEAVCKAALLAVGVEVG